MPNDITLNEDEQDCLQEFMNISFGTTVAAISKIIDKFATLGIPNIQTITSKELQEHISKKVISRESFFMASQLMHGELSGENLFIIDKTSATNLASEFDFEDFEINDDELKDIVLEITNIISSTTLSKLSSLLNMDVSFSSPKVDYIRSEVEFNKQYEFNYETIIIISTELKFEDQHIDGELVIMTNRESSIHIKKELNAVLDDI